MPFHFKNPTPDQLVGAGGIGLAILGWRLPDFWKEMPLYLNLPIVLVGLALLVWSVFHALRLHTSIGKLFHKRQISTSDTTTPRPLLPGQSSWEAGKGGILNLPLANNPKPEPVWLTPRQAFWELSDREYIKALIRARENIVLADAGVKNAQREWEELQAAHYRQYPSKTTMSIPPPDGNDEARDNLATAINKHNACIAGERFLVSEIMKTLLKNLEDSKFVAEGIRSGMMGIAQPIIPSHWRTLQLDIETSEATDGEITYRGVRISKP